MNQYTIYCTEEQTKKALELGAPITHNGLDNTPLKIPTAEQMLGWLEAETTIDRVNVSKGIDDKFHWGVYLSYKMINGSFEGCKTRKEATIAAINSALEYLTNQKSK